MKRQKAKIQLASFGKCLVVAAVLVSLIGCRTAPPAETKKASTPPATPLPPQAEEVTKPVNVSFSTYSKEWGVGWQWVDPDESNNAPTSHDIRTGVLRVHLRSKKDLSPEMQNAPRYIKAISGDFQIETRVRFNPTENYQGAGLVIYSDRNNFIRFERAYGGQGGGASGIRFDVNKSGVFEPIVVPGEIQTSANIIDLKIVRRGKSFMAFWREDENGEWRQASELTSDYPDTIMAGVIVCNSAREAVAEFEYIKLLPPAQ